MRSRLLVVIAAIVLGAVAAFVAVGYVSSARSRIRDEAKPVEVLVAVEDVPIGMSADEMLDRKLIERQAVPARYVAQGAISSPRVVDGQVLAMPMTKGEQVTSQRFMFPSTAGLAHTVPEGFIAVAIPTDVGRSVAGLLKPGDDVAVLGTVDPGSDDSARTRILIPKARVLAVGESVGAESADAQPKKAGGIANAKASDRGAAPASITLAVTPGDAERLVLVQEKGKVWLALLPATATDGASGRGQALDTVLGR